MQPLHERTVVRSVYRKLRPLDLMRESLDVGHDGRADLAVLESGFLTLQVQERT